MKKDPVFAWTRTMLPPADLRAVLDRHAAEGVEGLRTHYTDQEIDSAVRMAAHRLRDRLNVIHADMQEIAVQYLLDHYPPEEN